MQSNFCHLQADRLVDQGGISRDANERAFQLTNRRFKARSNQFEHRAIDFRAIRGSLLHQNRNARFEIWRLDVRDEAALEAGTQAILQGGQLLWRTVGGQDDLFVGLVQRIKGMEELLLRGLLAFQELNVINHQDVEVAVAALE